MPQLTLHPGGRLIKIDWDAPEGAPGEDVSQMASTYLMEPAAIHSDVRLVDLFMLLRQDEVLQHIFMRDFAKEYVAAAFRLESVEGAGESGEDEIEYLELYNQWERDTKSNVLDGSLRLQFHGVGFLLKEDRLDNGHLVCRAGSRITYSICFRPIKDLLHLPLRYNADVPVLEGCTDDIKAYCQRVDTMKVEHATLGQIIHGVLWELSFHGAPEDTAEVVSSLNEQVSELMDALAQDSGGVSKPGAPDPQ